MHRVLIVEDDMVIAHAMQRHLGAWNCEAQCVEDFQDVVGAFAQFKPHLVLMDIGLPFFNGHHWCAQIRKQSSVPVIFLSSASDNMNILMALGMGADDFIAKPFDLAVLTAKVQAMLRRAYDFAGERRLIVHRGASLDLDDMTLTCEGRAAELTKNELRILQTLLEHKGKVVSREVLMERLWSTDCFIDDNTLTVNVARVRKKLEEIGLADFIVTRKGAGYMAP